MDAIKFLTRQHRHIESLFARYLRTPARRLELSGLIERAIVQHAALEEMHVYPLLRDRVPNGLGLSEHAIEEHARVERTIDHLKSLEERPLQYDESMRELIASVRHHVREEERSPGLLKMLRDALSRDELADLGRRLEEFADMTPTRAHPLAPDHPPANMLLGLPVAAIDRVRDRLSGRAEAAENAERAPSRGTRRTPTRKRTTTRRKPTKRAGARRRATAKVVRRTRTKTKSRRR